MDEKSTEKPEAQVEVGSSTHDIATLENQPNEESVLNPPTYMPESSPSTTYDEENDPAPQTPTQHAKNGSGSASASISGTVAPPTRLETAIIVGSLCMAVFLAALDNTIIATALPTISEHFHSNAGYTWVGSAYLLANAASTPSWGKISDIWGRKPILLTAAGVFFIGSLLAGVSVNIGMLIAARGIQGIGGGGLIVLVNICISDLFSIRSRGTYFGIIGMVWSFASTIGPLLGGVFTQKASWRWCFYINLPITGIVIILLIFFLKLHTPKTPVWEGLKAMDWAGSLAITGGTLMLLLGLEFGGVTHPWDSATVVCLIIFGVITTGLFVLNEWKFARYPVMPLRLFNEVSNIASLGVCFCHGFVFIAISYYLPLYFQGVLGATPLLSGVYLLPFVLSFSFISGSTGVWIKKTGKYLPAIWFGAAILPLGIGLFVDLDAKWTWAKIIIFQIIAGIGVGPNFQSPLLALQSRINPKDIATATATFGFIRNLSTAISIVIGGVVFQNEMDKKYPSLVTSLGLQTANSLRGSAGSGVDIVNRLPPAQRAVGRQAFFTSLRTMWIMYVAFAGLGLLISFFIANKELSRVHQITKTGLAEQEQEQGRKVDTEEKKPAISAEVSKEDV